MEEQYKGVHGFKNGAPAYSSNNWADVQLFLDTWGFLPGQEVAILNSLSKEQVVELCEMALEASCKMEFEGKYIKVIQERMHTFGISPEAISKCKSLN